MSKTLAKPLLDIETLAFALADGLVAGIHWGSSPTVCEGVLGPGSVVEDASDAQVVRLVGRPMGWGVPWRLELTFELGNLWRIRCFSHALVDPDAVLWSRIERQVQAWSDARLTPVDEGRYELTSSDTRICIDTLDGTLEFEDMR